MTARSRRVHTVTHRHSWGMRRLAAIATALATSALGLVAFAPSALAAPQVFTVNSTADPGDGTCDTTCTLRDAILASNASAGDHDVIQFAIGTGPVTISPTSDLPTITDQVTIDGTTQPGFGGTPLIYIDGNADTGGPNKIGLFITAGGTVVEDLAISRFVSRQILLQNAGSSSIVGSYIGVGADGNTPLLGGGNFGQVEIFQSDDTQVTGSVIGGGSSVGVDVDNNQTGVSIAANNIGVGADGVTDVGNNTQGILLLGTNIRGTSIRYNWIANNGQLGIDLGGDGTDGNDALDADTGANNIQNYPVITNVHQDALTAVSGTLDSLPSETFHLDVFASTTCDPSGNGEGEMYLESGDAVTNASGHATFSIGFASPPPGYDFYTTTATADLSGVGNETSEFSACHTVDVPVITPPFAPTGTSAGAGDGTAQVSWNPPGSTGSSPIDHYTVTSSPSTSPVVVDGSLTTASFSGLTNGTNYTFTVSATNEDGATGPQSAPSNQVQPQNGAPDPESDSTQFGTGGGTLSTGTDATAADPTNTTVQTPNAGTVTIGESTLTGTPPAGVTYFGQQVDIDAPDATANNPMTFTFVFDCSVLPAEVSSCSTPFAPLAAPEALAPAPTSASVNVNNGSYSPSISIVRQGGTVSWHFRGTRQHSVADTVGLGAGGGRLFNSGNRNPGSTYSYSFAAAGQYKYRSFASGDRASMKGIVSVPVDVSRDTAAPTDPVTVTWATSRPSGFRFDVQYRYKTPTGAYGGWRSFRSNTLMTSSSFTGAGLRGQGTYQFRSHLENMNTGRKSGWSDGAATVAVSTTTTGGSGQHIAEVAMFHDDLLGGNVQLPDCTGADGVVQPGPACTWSETVNGDGDLVVVVYTTHNNRWRGGKVAAG
jgi:CSLREA domain-containing protein